MVDYCVFTTLDYNYAEPSWIALSSFREHNSNIPVFIFCVNFTDEQFKWYETATANALSNMHCVNLHPEYIDDKDFQWNISYKDIVQGFSAKFAAMNMIKNPWMLHIDIDTVFLGSVESLLLDHEVDFLGVRSNPHYKHCNCGFFIARNLHIDYVSTYMKWFKEHAGAVYNPDEEFLVTVYSKIAYLDEKYNINGYTELPTNPVMIHYCGEIKPFLERSQENSVCLNFNKYYSYWYNQFNKVLDMFPFTSSFTSRIRELMNKEYHPLEMSNNSILCRMILAYKCSTLEPVIKYCKKRYEASK